MKKKWFVQPEAMKRELIKCIASGFSETHQRSFSFMFSLPSLINLKWGNFIVIYKFFHRNINFFRPMCCLQFDLRMMRWIGICKLGGNCRFVWHNSGVSPTSIMMYTFRHHYKKRLIKHVTNSLLNLARDSEGIMQFLWLYTSIAVFKNNQIPTHMNLNPDLRLARWIDFQWLQKTSSPQ